MKYIIISMLGLLFFSCSDFKYGEDKTISNRAGVPADSLISYLPGELTYGSRTEVFDLDVDAVEAYNHFYRMTYEPLLYNYYLDRDIFRFVLTEEGKQPLIFSINKYKDRTWIVSKKITQLERVPLVEDSTLVSTEPLLKSDFLNYMRDLDEVEAQRFDSIWQATSFYDIPTDANAIRVLSNKCLIEAHTKGKYKYIQSPKDDLILLPLQTYVRSLTGF